MSAQTGHDAWSAGRSYDHYMGRWSRQIADQFLDWLDPPDGADWIEAGCGTGALTSAILRSCAPASILATDASEEFIAHAHVAIGDPRARFRTADARALPTAPRSMDAATSGLMLNFVSDPPAALGEMRRVLRPGGLLSFYVWDYPGGGTGFIDAFWKAAAAIDPEAAAMDEAARFPMCTAEGLAALCAGAGIGGAKIVSLEIATRFEDFEAFWHPFTLGAGPAPGYCAHLAADRRAALKALLAERLDRGGAIELRARPAPRRPVRWRAAAASSPAWHWRPPAAASPGRRGFSSGLRSARPLPLPQLISVMPPLRIRSPSPFTVVIGDFASSIAVAWILIIGPLIVTPVGSILIELGPTFISMLCIASSAILPAEHFSE
nr:class I SAM-dependent methyltransferase [Mangrovicoccus ximenensis]